MKEVWKLIDGCKYHEVSNTGKVRSVGNIVRTKDGRTKKMPDRELKGVVNEHGYARVGIKENGIGPKKMYVHRLVAQAFIPNRENKRCVNHIDNNPLNNSAENLEWVTHQENTDWMISQGRNKRTKEWLDNLHKSQEKYYVPVVGVNEATGEVVEYKSVNSARAGGFLPSMVSSCINGERKSHHGYTWRRA